MKLGRGWSSRRIRSHSGSTASSGKRCWRSFSRSAFPKAQIASSICCAVLTCRAYRLRANIAIRETGPVDEAYFPRKNTTAAARSREPRKVAALHAAPPTESPAWNEFFLFHVNRFAARGVLIEWRGVLRVYPAIGHRLWSVYWIHDRSQKAARSASTWRSFATSYRGPWKLIYYEAYLNRDDAEGRERYLKSGAGRRFMRAQLKHHLKTISNQVSRVNRFAPRG